MSQLRRACFSLALVAALLAVAGPAWAAASKVSVDKQSWFWRGQVDQEVNTGDLGVPGAPAAVQRVRQPSPFPPGRLPVSLSGSEDEKISAVHLDLVAAGVPAGSTVSKLVVTFQEADDQADAQHQLENGDPWQPQSNQDQAVILACPITEFWSGTDGAEPYTTVNKDTGETVDVPPEYDCANAVEGKRDAAKAAWTFDLTSLAAGWAADPLTNNGVMLTPKLPEAGNSEASPTPPFQVVLVGNQRTESGTTKAVSTTVTYEPAVAAPPPSTDTGTSGGGFDFSDTTPAEEPLPEEPASAPDDAAAPEAAPAAAPLPEVELPAYVWGLIPAGLLGLSLVRASIMDPGGAHRADGVLAAIRMQNETRRGPAGNGSGPQPSGNGKGSSAGRLRRSLAGAASTIRHDVASIRSKLGGKR